MRTLWRLLINKHAKSRLYNRPNFYLWRNQLKHNGLTPSVRLALRENLKPFVALEEPLRFSVMNALKDEECISKFVRWEIALSSNYVHNALRDLSEDKQWKAALPELLDDFSALLRDALDLMRELGNKIDHSCFHQPSISKHPQNKGLQGWTALIELARDAWLATAEQSPERARIAAEAWRCAPYPIFWRLALFAAAQGCIIPLPQALDWLLADDRRWLWSIETHRETIRLLVSLAPQLDATMLAKLEQAILSGPPGDPYNANIEPDTWKKSIVDQGVWLRLAKIAQTGTILNEAGQSRLDALSEQYQWQLATDERDEFLTWIESAVSIDNHDPWMQFTPIPRTRRGVLDYLLAKPILEDLQQDDWRELCSEMFQETADALCKLAQQNNWPTERWRDALQAWGEENLRSHSWDHMAPVVVDARDDLVQALSHWWLKTIAKTFEGHDNHFRMLVYRILRLDFKSDDDTDDPVSHAINHPVGHVTQALLDWWYRQEPEDEQGLPEFIKPIFTELCDTKIAKFRHGRVLLVAHAVPLFRVR